MEKAKQPANITSTEKFLLSFEKITIITYVVSVLVLATINIHILTENGRIIPMYSYTFMNQRVMFPWYLSDIYLLPVRQPEEQCRTNFKKLDFAAIENIFDVNLNNISNITKIQDKLEYGKLRNISFLKEKYYDFNISQIGNNKTKARFPLVNRYTLNNWKGANFCLRRVYFDEWYQGFHIINSNTSCSAAYPKNIPIDCGVYGIPEYGAKIDDKERYMRLCILKDQIYSDEDLTIKISASKDEKITGANFCPINNFDSTFYENPAYDTTDVNSWFYNFRSMTVKENKPLELFNEYPQTEYESRMNPLAPGVMSLFTVFDNTYFQLNQAYPKPDDAFVFGLIDSATLFPGKPYGLTDLVSEDIDSYDFFRVFNDTFYEKLVFDQAENSYSFQPNFAVKDNEKEYIMPEQVSGEAYKITLPKNVNPLFVKSCFSQVFEANKNPDFLNFFKKLSIKFIEEYVVSSISLCLMTALLAFYNELYIRYYVINRILDNDINDYDKDSEKYTKYTHKTWEFVILIISTYYQFFNIGLIEEGMKSANLLRDNNCFVINNPPSGESGELYKDNLNNMLQYYINFLINLNTEMKAYLAILVINFLMMIFVTLSYAYLSYIKDDSVLNTELEDIDLEEERKN